MKQAITDYYRCPGELVTTPKAICGRRLLVEAEVERVVDVRWWAPRAEDSPAGGASGRDDVVVE